MGLAYFWLHNHDCLDDLFLHNPLLYSLETGHVANRQRHRNQRYRHKSPRRACISWNGVRTRLGQRRRVLATSHVNWSGEKSLRRSKRVCQKAPWSCKYEERKYDARRADTNGARKPYERFKLNMIKNPLMIIFQSWKGLNRRLETREATWKMIPNQFLESKITL